MKKHLILPTLAIAALISLVSLGITKIAFLFFAICTGAILVSYYFSSRETGTPTAAEKIAATGWLFIRRVVCFTAAIPFAGVTIEIMRSSGTISEKFWGIGLSLMMSVFFVWVGIFGQGWQRLYLKDDAA